jgi:hypothetical protein
MLAEEHRQIVLAHLNDIAPDTFNEGEFSDWSFPTLKLEGSTWMLAFRNSGTEGSEVVQFSFEGDAVDANGAVQEDWMEALNAAIFGWESEPRGDFGDE